jgi:hypothetical protein
VLNPGIRRGALLALLVLANACGDSVAPTAPTTPAATRVSTATPPPVSGFPPVSKPARIYLFASELSYQVRDFTRGSRYVLHDDGTFALQYLQSRGSPEYRGTYTETNGLLTFAWEGWSTAGPWGASGSLSDESLTVRYNTIMELSDFENAVYVRTP